MISSITNQGKVRFMLYQEKMSSPILIRFMSRLIKDCEQKVFLILDNLHVHHSKKVAKWLGKHSGKIAVFYLPPYAPEYNPDEYLNGGLKKHIRSGLVPRSQDDISKKTRSFMRTLQRQSHKVISLFQHPKIAYAANVTI